MSVRSKNNLSRIVYYTLAVLTVLSSAFFVYCLVIKDVAMWAKVVYFIWTAAVVGVTIYDVICTGAGEGKYTTGLIVYVLSLLALAMACILYFLNAGMAGLATEFFNLFISISIISLFVTGFMIATWCVGAHRVENDTVEEKIQNRQ